MYQFLEFRLDPKTGLTRQGEPIPLEPQALQLLEFLIRHRDGIVSKEDIITEIWDGNAITDAALNTRIRSVRKALGDTAATSEFIKTFPKRGFQFVAPVSTEGDPAQRPAAMPNRWVAALGVLAATGIALAVFSMSDKPQTKLDTRKPSLAVVQFDNLSEAADVQYFVEGLT